MLRVFQRAWWRLKWAGWRLVHGLVIPTFLICRKKQYFVFEKTSRFLCFCEIHNFKICGVIISITSSEISIYAYFCWILSTLKKKFGQIFLTCFLLQTGNWKLVPGSFMILLKWQYSEIWKFLIVNTYSF